MESQMEAQGVVLPHHEQQPLCTTRLPYRQGRKLTAVKVYTINNESNHLLVFGVPSLNLRQEAKALFSKFGKLLQFSISKAHPAEPFTETYHATYDRIQSARVAKKMLDTKNFYGGSLHVCYAPEFESILETRGKLLQRQKDVLFRLRNLQKETVEKKVVDNVIQVDCKKNDRTKMNMGDINTIDVESNRVKSKKRKQDKESVVIEKKFKPCFVSNIEIASNRNNSMESYANMYDSNINDVTINNQEPIDVSTNMNNKKDDAKIEIIDFTSTEKETITNINECLNYNKFGNEVIRKIPQKPVNKIRLHLGNKS